MSHRRARSALLRALLPVTLVLSGLVAVGLAPSAAVAATPVSGPDVASYQHPGGAAIDWPMVQAGGASIAIIKATEGTTYVNPYFASDWAGARRAGLVTGGYHFARPGSSSAAAQARSLVATLGSTREQGTLAPVLDLEESGGLSPTDLAAWAHTFLATVEQLTGRLPILYTYPSFWHRAMADDTSFGAFPLWLASYRASPPAALPGWSQWTLWQHTSSATLAGIPTLVDENYLCCGVGTLTALADGRSSQITALWRRLGGASSALGLPVGPEVQAPGGWTQPFQRGAIGYSRAHGAYALTGGIWSRWAGLGGGAGPLGLPIGDLTRPVPQAQQQLFAGGRITSSAVAGTHALRGAFLARWVADGGAAGSAGLPTSEQVERAVGSSQGFERAGYYVGTAAHGPGLHVLPVTIRDTYEDLGGPGSALGSPLSDAEPFLLGAQVHFERGVLVQASVG